eukprot:Em0021g343a
MAAIDKKKRLSDFDTPHTRVEEESDVEKRYTLGNMLGQGTFGTVLEATNKCSGQQYAMKIVNKDKPGSSAIQFLLREVEVLKRVSHPHIIKLEEVLDTPKKMYLVMELCQGGELNDMLKKKGNFKEQDAKVVMQQLIDAVVYLHDNDIVHRDLKLQNVMLSTSDPSDEFNIKVTDFGLAYMRSLNECNDDLMSAHCGTPFYMAPEVIKNKQEYSKLCDVWSLGVIMYELLCGKVPFQGDTLPKLEALILQGTLNFSEPEWAQVSEQAKSLIRGMLYVDTTQRYPARTVQEDAWIMGKPTKEHLNPLALMLEFIPTPQQQDQPQQPASPVSPTDPQSVSSELKPPKRLVKGQRSVSSSALGVQPPTGSGSIPLPTSRAHLEKKSSSTLPRVAEESDGVPKKRSYSTTSRPGGKK